MRFKKPLIMTALALLLFGGSGISSCKKKHYEAISREKKYPIVEITTDFGVMYMWLHDSTPLHKANFLKLTAEGFYNNTTFHRIINDFVIQGGDPNTKDSIKTNDGSGGPGYTIPAEIKDSLSHVFGAVGAARDNNPQKASNGSQFYIVTDRKGEPSLNKNYTVFGIVFYGMDIAIDISKKAKDLNNRPNENITMKVKLLEKTLPQLKSEFSFVPPRY